MLGDEFPIRISSIGQWATCERQALHFPRRSARTAVSAWVGVAAHALLSGADMPDPPRRITFDPTTRTVHEARHQATMLSNAGRVTLEDAGWHPYLVEHAVHADPWTGHADLICWHQGRGDAIIDLKTGRSIEAGWLQVGAYALAHDQYVGEVGILHLPRQQKGQAAVLEMRDADTVKAVTKAQMNRVSDVLAGAVPLAQPGMHCARCSDTVCPVRAGS